MAPELTTTDLAAGRARLQQIVDQFDGQTLRRAGSHPHARTAARQPWLVAGVSDGIGLHAVLAAIESGVMKTGLGVYWEPPHFLEKRDDGTPVSPVHWARVQNAAALEEWAREKGVDFRVMSANVIMAPQRSLKGEKKGEPSEFSPEIVEAFEPIRGRASGDDIVFVNSVAFGKWISPREGEDPIAVPTVDFQGRIIEMRTKKYHARGYQETLDTMGRNHGLLLEAIREFGWLGPDALTAFFTWAGGSQNVEVLEGIYGKGALGDAKVIAERDVAAFRLEHGLDLGAHAIVRLPAFLSAALMGIPGGGLFGLISREYLESRGLFEGMPRLAERMMDKMFGPAWIRENPIAQIELDTAETLYIEPISDRVAQAHERIERYWSKNPETRDEAIPLRDSHRLLDGLAPANYPQLLRRFDPDTAPTEEPTPDDDVALENVANEFRPDLTLVQALQSLAGELTAKESDDLAVHSDHVELDAAAWHAASRVQCRAELRNGGDQLVLFRSLVDDGGREIARGETVLGPRHDQPSTRVDTALIGEAVGPRMPVRVDLHETYDDVPESLRHVVQGPALISFARENLKVAGVFEDELPSVWDIRVDGTVLVGDHLLTYARRESDGWVVTVVNDDSRPVLQMTLR